MAIRAVGELAIAMASEPACARGSLSVQASRAPRPTLVLEVAAVREDHADPGGVGGLDDLVVAH